MVNTLVRYNTLLRYIVIAGLAYLVDVGGFYMLISIGWSAVVSNVIVKVVAMIFAFFMHRRFTYLITGNRNRKSHAIKYFLIGFIYTPTSTLFLYYLMLLEINAMYAKIVSDIVLFTVTFFVTTKVTFNK